MDLVCTPKKKITFSYITMMLLRIVPRCHLILNPPLNFPNCLKATLTADCCWLFWWLYL